MSMWIDGQTWDYGLGAVHGLIAAVEERGEPDDVAGPYGMGWWAEYVDMADVIDGNG